MSRQELAALGIILNTTDRGTMSEASTAVGTSVVEIFSLNLYSKNINSSTVEGQKLCIIVTKKLGKDKRISVLIEN